ncbi:MAG: tetratricopeptide repeat protein [Limisphaerales bacterium]
MRLCFRWIGWLFLGMVTLRAQPGAAPITQRAWYQAATAHFEVYSCGTPPEINKLAAQLEQFCKAYSMLAGVQAVHSPPTVVMAFPDHESMAPFLPVYDGKPANLSGFFKRGSDENLIVLSMSDASGMDVIFHEYTHLLLRHNDLIWPLWLKEGMAEIYSTFQTGDYQVQIARPIDHHLALLEHEPLMPLAELFAVTPASPQYNESTRQGIFYAESWLLTHYLMVGADPNIRARFARYNYYLNAGELPEQAFTNVLGMSLPEVELQLRDYLAAGQFNPISLPLSYDLSAPIYVSTRVMAPVEVDFRLGDELLRLQRPDAAESYFIAGQKLAPTSPLPEEGLGLLAARRGQHAQAIDDLQKSLQLGSTDFITHFTYAKEKLDLTGDGQGRYHRLDEKDGAAEIGGELEQAVTLMPSFADGHELLGFFEMLQGDEAATVQLQAAIQLEPENPAYVFTLAQAELEHQDLETARQTLAPLLRPNTDSQIREQAEELLKQINSHHP